MLSCRARAFSVSTGNRAAIFYNTHVYNYIYSTRPCGARTQGVSRPARPVNGTVERLVYALYCHVSVAGEKLFVARGY